MTKDKEELGQFFRKAEDELVAVAKRYGFHLHLIDTIHGDWVFYPQVDAGWKPEQNDFQI